MGNNNCFFSQSKFSTVFMIPFFCFNLFLILLLQYVPPCFAAILPPFDRCLSIITVFFSHSKFSTVFMIPFFCFNLFLILLLQYVAPCFAAILPPFDRCLTIIITFFFYSRNFQ